jgi:hypothetical protein
MRNFVIVPLTKNDRDDQIKENEVGGACGTYGKKRNEYMV